MAQTDTVEERPAPVDDGEYSLLTEKLTADIERGDLERARETLWETLLAFAGCPFKTAKRLEYTYSVRGNELFFSRKEKSVTRASVNMAFDTALRLQREGAEITGPKMLGCFGASYIYPVFIKIGVIRGEREEPPLFQTEHLANNGT